MTLAQPVVPSFILDEGAGFSDSAVCKLFANSGGILADTSSLFVCVVKLSASCFYVGAAL